MSIKYQFKTRRMIPQSDDGQFELNLSLFFFFFFFFFLCVWGGGGGGRGDKKNVISLLPADLSQKVVKAFPRYCKE